MKKPTVRLAVLSCLVLLAAVPTGVYAANPYIQAKFEATTGSLGPWTSVSGEAGGEAHYVPIGQQIDFTDKSGVVNPMPDGQNQPNPDAITKREWCKDGGAWIELPQGTVTWTYAATELGDFIIKERVWANTTPNNAICSMKFTPVRVASITVKEGATQTNVTGNKNWAAVKGEGDVIVEVTLEPTNTDAAASVITWEGGSAVPGHLRQRKVSKATAAKTTVKATAGTSSAELDVWIIWATLTLRRDGNKSAGNNSSFPAGWGGDKLGALTDEDDAITVGETTGKVEVVATLSPAGVHNVVKAGWDIRRWIVFRDYSNGALSDAGNRGDTSAPAYKDLVPDADERIYDIDGPTCGVQFVVNHTKETYNNFRQWATWNDTTCSDEIEWHYQARVDDDLNAPPHGSGNDDTELNDADAQHIQIPQNAHYPAR